MSDRRATADSLCTLGRLRELELEHAQVEHASATSIAEQRKRSVEQSETEIAELQEFARACLTGSGRLSADALRRMNTFAALQAQQLDAARTAWQQSQDRCAETLCEVVERFEELAVIERLRERRAVEANKDLARRDQKRLDEQALTRVVGESKISRNRRE